MKLYKIGMRESWSPPARFHPPYATEAVAMMSVISKLHKFEQLGTEYEKSMIIAVVEAAETGANVK